MRYVHNSVYLPVYPRFLVVVAAVVVVAVAVVEVVGARLQLMCQQFDTRTTRKRGHSAYAAFPSRLT